MNKYIDEYDNIRNKTFADIRRLTERLKGELFMKNDFYTFIKYKDENDKELTYVIYDKKLKDKCCACLVDYSEKYLIECNKCNTILCRPCYREKDHKLSCQK